MTQHRCCTILICSYFSGSLRQLEELEVGQESLNNSLLALTSHFAQVIRLQNFAIHQILFIFQDHSVLLL